MDELSDELKTFLRIHPCFELTADKKVKCTLNGHEFPCSVTELQKFTQAKKFKTLSAAAEFNYSQFEPHIVPSSKRPNQLFCKLTLRHLNQKPHHVMRHVSGKRFKKALAKYEECQKQGIEFVPARLKQKRPKDSEEDVRHGHSSKRGNGMWEPTSSEGEHSDSEDSMSDLYPPSMFTLKNPPEQKEGDCDEEDGFMTDEEEQMEKPTVTKRKKAQNPGFKKKFRNNNWKAARSKKQKKCHM
ncbi:surfeit locus protein 2 [Periophthalmus magnuspinnatus]|uniref:surfeit locus protein 2 n=1 Tax=Periophthalmus magnuspinnatus TaxID=409849 RepID=UPI00145BBAE7|nr:surfeit locus protein 2 [Periophthalmus magnuspinnatus]